MNKLDKLSEYFQHGTGVRKLSADYLEFIREELEKKSFYEKVCSFASTIIKINPGKDKAKELQQKLDFSNLKISATDVYSAFVLMIILTIFIDTASFISLLSLNYEIGETVRYIFVVSLVGFALAYYILLYPSIYAKKVRVDAAAEIVKKILYKFIGL